MEKQVLNFAKSGELKTEIILWSFGAMAPRLDIII